MVLLFPAHFDLNSRLLLFLQTILLDLHRLLIHPFTVTKEFLIILEILPVVPAHFLHFFAPPFYLLLQAPSVNQQTLIRNTKILLLFQICLH